MICALLWIFAAAAAGQMAPTTGALRGRVTICGNGAAVTMASVRIIQLDKSASTDADGRYEILDLPPGKYDVLSHMHALTDEIQSVEIVAGQVAKADFQLSFAPVHHEITVTATGREETAFETLQAVTSLDSFQLAGKNAFALGEVVKNQPGVNTRSFGPGSARPVLRGFDGDRVLILADGLPTGTLSAQSGEHAEPMDAAHLDRLEIVKGPATLLYGSNALGGIVNAVTEHHLLHEHPHKGLRGQVTAEGGSNDRRASGGADAEYGFKNRIFWGHGSRQIAGDYSSPEGRVENSGTRMSSANLGLGWFGERPFFTLGYSANRGRLGIPFAGEFHHHDHQGDEQDDEKGSGPAQVYETFTWQNVRMTAGVNDIAGAIHKVKIAANFSRWMHRELEGNQVATSFDNRSFNVRGTAEQRTTGPFSGSSGFHISGREYTAAGEEALAPPITSHGYAAFTLQEVRFKQVQIQFGGRLEHAGYRPKGMRPRSFTGLSAAAGLGYRLWRGGNFVANYTHSFRVPALEELYNHGPHIGNLAFEVGNPALEREAADGLDISVRHHGRVIHAQANFFHYRIRDFVYLAFTDEERHGLRVAAYSQADANYLGGEAQVGLAFHPNLWLNLGMDAVNAEIAYTSVALPRIPPMRGRFGIDARYRGFTFNPEVIVAASQNRLYPTETRTPGYAVINLDSSYIHAQAHHAHVFAVSVFNVGDRLYWNHLSFIKELAPEMGRGIRFSYSLRFY
jgi:iron complex outermembrane receptor protein